MQFVKSRSPVACQLALPVHRATAAFRSAFHASQLANPPSTPPPFCSIQTYLKTRQFSSPPEGRDMPQFDSSSYDRA